MLARLDRIPVWPYPTSLLWILGVGYFFAFFDVVNIGFALPTIASQFGVSTNLVSWSITASLIAYIIGAYIDGTIADIWGRRVSLIISVTFFTVGSIGTAFSFSIGWLIAWRVVIGFGIGAEIASVTTYLSEVTPSRLRGRYTSWAGVFSYAGFSAVPFVAFILVPNFYWGWRVMFLIGALGGITILFMRRGLRDTPRWLIEHGQNDKAREIIEKAEQHARKSTGEDLPAPEAADYVKHQKGFPTAELFKPPYLKRLIVLVAIWFFYYIGNYGWLVMAPTLIKSQGYSLTESLGYLAITGVGFLVGALLSVLCTDRFERKYSLIVILLVWSLFLFIVGFWPLPWVIMVAGFIVSATIGLLVPIMYTLTGEHFTTLARATGVALSDGLGHLGGAIAPPLVLWADGIANFAGALSLMAVSGLIVVILMLFVLNTTKLPLETINKIKK